MKHDEIYDELLREIVQGRWKEGEKLPTERDLSERYGVSRPTIGRVLNRLRTGGYVQRSVGAGTFLTKPQEKGAASSKTFGLFVPGLGRGEIFEPICARIAELSHAFNFSLTWGSIPLDQDENHEELLRMTAQRFIDNGIDGVFYQPVEREPGLVNFGLFVFFVQVVTRYFDLLGGMLQGGLMFIGAGILLVAVGVALERSRRSLLRSMTQRSES